MEELEHSYEDALKLKPTEVEAIKAPAGRIAEIRRFENLRSLDLTDNRDIDGFDFLQQLPGLQKLYLADMGLTEIPAQVAQLPKLTTLFIGKNQIKDFTLLAELSALIDLGLEEMSLKKIPDAVLALSQLEVLGLYGNNIGAIATLTKLPQLRELYVASNSLKKIPKELARLENLRKLDIKYNYKLTDWSVVGELEKLEELSMSNAHAIEALPVAAIFELRNLRELDLEVHWNAPADALDGLEAIGNLEKLERLVLHGTSVEALPPCFSELVALKKLDLSDNEKLANVDALHDLPALKQLDLSKCGIERIAQPFSTLKALEKLLLSHNKPLEDVSGLRDLPALRELELYSKLTALPAEMGSLSALENLRLSAKGAKVGFLGELKNLEELYIADCDFGELPKTLRKLRKLTVYCDKALTLPSYPALKELQVNAPSFTLPALTKLETLGVGQIEDELNLAQLGKSPELRSLRIHRSKKLASLPALGAGGAIESVCLEFMDALSDVSALGELGGLRELELRYVKALQALPETLGALKKLSKLTISDASKLTDIDVLGQLASLEQLGLHDSAQIKRLPESLAGCKELRRIVLDDLDALEDISVLSTLAGLSELDVVDCDELPRKMVTAVKKAIAARVETTVSLKMSYQQFIDSGHYQALGGKSDSKRSYDFPLWFDQPETLLEALEDFSWLDDHRDDEQSEGAAILAGESDLVPLAIPDFGFEGCDTSQIDSYSEEIFLVDTQNAKNPVLIWGHDGDPSRIHETFDEFLACLQDFSIAGETDDEDANASNGDGDQGRTYLEYKDEKSSKFWQIVVEGDSHTVTYGKIGAKGTSKKKSFADAQAAQKDADKLIASKTKKGYQPA
jgi:Leucine-rich repeat (LRR) protein/predicted DNA-binding WGR domain protein